MSHPNDPPELNLAASAPVPRAGLVVLADCVNPVAASRAAWRAVAAGVPVAAIEIEIVCSDRAEHRRRVATRTTDIPGLPLPTWDEIEAGDYQPWDRERVVVDTAGRSIEETLSVTRAILAMARSP